MDKNYDPDAGYRRLPLLPLPAVCPACSAELRKGNKKVRFNFKALGLGLLFSLAFLVVILLIWPEWSQTLFKGYWIPNFDDLGWIFLGLPFFIGIRVFWEYDKVVVMTCSACSWEKEFLDKNREKFQLDSRVETQGNPSAKDSSTKESHPVYLIKDENEGIAWEPDFSLHPTHCPDCHGELMEPRARRPKWVPIMVAWHSLHMIVGLPLLLYLYDYGWITFVTGNARLLVFFALAGLPALTTAYYRSSGRILPYECYACGWKKCYSLQEIRKYDLPKEAYR